MMESSIALVHRFYDAMHAGDVAGLLATLAPDFVGHVSEGIPGGYGGTHVGGEHMLRDCWAPIHRTFGALPYPSRYLVAEPGHVIVTGEYRGTPSATRRQFTAAFAHVHRLDENKIAELHQITDTCQWARALSNIDVAKAVFDAVRARDLDALLRVYSDDIVIRDDPRLPYGGEYQGRDGAIQHAAGFAGTWDPHQSHSDRDPAEVLLDAGTQIVAVWQLRASHRHQRLDQTTVSLLNFENGRVVSLEMFHRDTGELRAFLNESAAGAQTRVRS
jgi:ketosteroid isomerase-like protein